MSKFHHHFEIVKVEKFCILNEFPSQKVQIWRSLLTNKACWWNLLIFKMYSCIRAIKTLPHEWVLYTAMYQINFKTTHDSTSISLVQSCLFLLLIIPHSTPIFHLHHHKAIFGMVVQLNGVSSLFHHPFDLFLESKPLKRKYFFTSKFMGSWITLFWHMPWHHRKMYQQQLKGETKTKLGQQTKFI